VAFGFEEFEERVANLIAAHFSFRHDETSQKDDGGIIP